MKILLLIIAMIPLVSSAQEQVTTTSSEPESKERQHNIKLKAAYGFGFQYEQSIHENISIGAEFSTSSVRAGDTTLANLSFLAATADYYFSGTFQNGVVASLSLGSAKFRNIPNEKKLQINGDLYKNGDRFLIVSSALSYQLFFSSGFNSSFGLNLSSSKLNSNDVHLYVALGYSF